MPQFDPDKMLKLVSEIRNGYRAPEDYADTFAILGEPDSGLDILALNRIVKFTRDLKERGTIVILITHRTNVARIVERALS